tara:strand:+ start:1271 stop:1480 length:210 start_codon:yes stop_codon:yes gene_type:complete
MEIEIQIILNLLPILGAMIGVYVALTREIEKLKGRVYSLESDRKELKVLVKECVEGINELKILIAKKGI